MCHRRGCVARGYQLLYLEIVKFQSKELKEFALVRIVTITKYNLPLKMLLIVSQLVLNIRALRVKFVLLGYLCFMEGFVITPPLYVDYQ